MMDIDLKELVKVRYQVEAKFSLDDCWRCMGDELVDIEKALEKKKSITDGNLKARIIETNTFIIW